MVGVLTGPVLQGSPLRRIDILIRILLDPLVLALVLGGLMALFLFSLEVVTVVAVWRRSRRDRARDARRPAVRDGLFERVIAEDSDWEAWAASLDEVERDVARDLVDTYLRTVRGREHERLQAAGRALGIPDEAVTTIEDGDRTERLQALSWLTLLEHPVDPALLRAHCRADPTLRAAAARLVSATGGAASARDGTRLLLEEPVEPLTSFGIDTLYELHREEPAGLFEYASEASEAWPATVKIQVLRVLREYTRVGRDVPTDWLVPLFEHERPAVRAAAVGAFEGFGWRADLRGLVPHERLAGDHSVTVRRAYASVLASWNTDAAQARLESMAWTDPGPRVRLEAARGLADAMLAPERSAGDQPAGTSEAVREWVRAERSVPTGGVGL